MSAEQKASRQLEFLLERATHEPAYRPEFYQRLMDAHVLVISGDEKPGGQDEMHLKEGDTVNLVQWPREDGTNVLPFFTSVEMLQKAIDREVSYLSLPARALFQMTEGTMLVINPFSDFGKEFTPEEISTLLAGGIPGGHAEEKTIQKDTQVLLGQPKNYPGRLVESLTTLFAQEQALQKAYLAQMFNPSEGQVKPHLIIGLQAESKAAFGELLKKVGAVATDCLPDGDVVDFIFIEPDAPADETGVAGYMIRETKPFYEARWRDGINLFADSKNTKN